MVELKRATRLCYGIRNTQRLSSAQEVIDAQIRVVDFGEYSLIIIKDNEILELASGPCWIASAVDARGAPASVSDRHLHVRVTGGLGEEIIVGGQKLRSAERGDA